MQKQKRFFYKNKVLTALFSCLMILNVQAAKSTWTFVEQTPTEITLEKGSSTQVIYTVHNQSSKPKTLIMKPIPGINQSTPCQLAGKGTCTLILNINGSSLQGDITGGPILCQRGNNLQCYQPKPTHTLHIRLITNPLEQFTIIPSAGANGSISPSTTQMVNAGSSLTFTATPDSGFGVDQWLLDGNVVQNGGLIFQLNTIQANHTIEATFNQTTLSPSKQNLALSINNPSATPSLIGNPRVIQITNTGSVPANNLQISTSGLPNGTSIIPNTTCTGNLNAGDTCNITITPGSNASLNASSNPCTASPGTEPVPTIITVSADNVLPTHMNVLILGYGCIYQGGFLFSVDDTTANTDSIGGKVAALTNEPNTPYQWATISNYTSAISITNGLTNTNSLATPANQYPAAQACLNKSAQGFDDWFLPAICELGRFVGIGRNAGCGTTNPNLYSTLFQNNLGNLNLGSQFYWSSTEFAAELSWFQLFSNGSQNRRNKDENIVLFQVRCIRALTL